jgi:hypothetical protein
VLAGIKVGKGGTMTVKGGRENLCGGGTVYCGGRMNLQVVKLHRSIMQRFRKECV